MRNTNSINIINNILPVVGEITLFAAVFLNYNGSAIFDSVWANRFFVFSVLSFFSIFLQYIFVCYKFTEFSSYLPFFICSVSFAAFIGGMENINILFKLFFLLLSVFRIMSLSINESKSTLFDSFFFLAVTTIFFPKIVLLIPVYFVLAISYKCRPGRIFYSFLMSFFSVYFVYFGIGWLMSKPDEFMERILSAWTFNVFFDMQYFVYYVYMAVLLLSVLVSAFLKYAKRIHSVSERNNLMLVRIFCVLFFVLWITSGSFFNETLFILFFSLVVLVSHYLHLVKGHTPTIILSFLWIFSLFSILYGFM